MLPAGVIEDELGRMATTRSICEDNSTAPLEKLGGCIRRERESEELEGKPVSHSKKKKRTENASASRRGIKQPLLFPTREKTHNQIKQASEDKVRNEFREHNDKSHKQDDDVSSEPKTE